MSVEQNLGPPKSPSRKPHHAMKWSMLVALFAVVMVGIPQGVRADQPSVQAPTGSKIGSVFVGPYTFSYQINCESGVSWSDSYSDARLGTHTYRFVGAPDGSLLVKIDGVQQPYLASCGTPGGTPQTTVATYTVTYDPSYTGPTATPTPTPTPTPPPSGGGGGGGGTKPTATPKPGAAATPTPAASTPTPAPTPTASATPTPTPGGAGAVATPSPSPGATPAPVEQSTLTTLLLGWLQWWPWLVGLLLFVAAGFGAYRLMRWPAFRAWAAHQWFRLRLWVQPRWFRFHVWARRNWRIHGRELPKKPGLSHHEHSGRVMAHHHTSYPALIFLVLISSVLAGAYTVSTQAANTDLTLTVLGPPPSVAATIDDPMDGQAFTNSTTTVNGTCPPSVFVEVYRNGTFAGSAVCSGGVYNVLITLTAGSNELVARVADALGQYGPDSNSVTATYTAPLPTPTPTPTPAPTSTPQPTPSPTPGGTATPKPTAKPVPTPSSVPTPTVGGPLILTDRTTATGIDAGAPFEWTVTLRGGTPTYRVDWDWGDGHRVRSEGVPVGRYTLAHTYERGGVYRIVVRITDRFGREAAMSLVAVVTGDAPAPVTGTLRPEGTLLVAWPMLVAVMLLVLSFWLGERHKQTIWRRQHAPTPA